MRAIGVGLTLLVVSQAGGAAVDPRVSAAIAGGAKRIGVIVQLAGEDAGAASDPGVPRVERRAGVLRDARERHALAAGAVLGRLGRATVSDVEAFWVGNALALRATPAAVARLARDPAVTDVFLDDTVVIVPQDDADAIETPRAVFGVAHIRAPRLWDLGIRGRGTVVGGIDTGVRRSHPDLAPGWRGGANSWLDVIGGRAAPYDDNGHGTHTMGTAVGRSASGIGIGVAPAAQWIACKAFDATGSASARGILRCMQFMADPDGNPATDDAPDVVNNSWGGSSMCTSPYTAAIRTWRQLGIVPVFAAGNSGPFPGSAESPGNIEGAFAVGALTRSDTPAGFSSRGPSRCRATLFPDLAAPGTQVRSAWRDGGYKVLRGTSMATPHVTGAVALLREAKPAATVDEILDALRAAAADVAAGGPDPDTGAGRLDVLAAARRMSPTIALLDGCAR